MDLKAYMAALGIDKALYERFRKMPETAEFHRKYTMAVSGRLNVSSSEIYDMAAEIYDPIFSSNFKRKEKVLDELGGVMSELSGKKGPLDVLEVGCATGFDACYLAMNNPDHRFVGIDGSRKMIEKSEEKRAGLCLENIEFYNRTFEENRFGPESFDLVYMVSPDWKWSYDQNLRKAAGILRTGGVYEIVKTLKDRSKAGTKSHTYKNFRGFEMRVVERVEDFEGRSVVLHRADKASV